MNTLPRFIKHGLFKIAALLPIVVILSGLFIFAPSAYSKVRHYTPDENGVMHIILADGNQVEVVAASDDDGDKIPNELEINGFVVQGDSIAAWDGDESKKYFITDWRRASTDGDPYTDYSEALGVGLPAGVFPPEDNPLVAARPRITVKMTSYQVEPLVTITDSQGGAVGNSYTNEVSNSTTVGVEVTEGVEIGTDGFNTNVSVTGSYSETQTFTESTTRSSEINWDKARSTQPDKAARLELQVYVENIGSVSALDVIPTVNLKLGDKVIETFTLPQAESLTPAGTSSSRYPEAGTINIGRANGNEITITLEELKAIELRTPLTLEVVQVSANVVTIDDTNNSINKSWNNYISEIELVSVDIIANIGSEDYHRHQVFAGWTRWDPEYTFQELLERIFDVDDSAGSIKIENRTYPDEWYVSSSSEKVLDEWENTGRPDNILNMRMYPNTKIIMSSPGNDANPIVNIASYSRLMSDTTATSEYTRVLVSAVPNKFPISLVTSEIPINGKTVVDTLTQNNYGFYVNKTPFTDVPDGAGKVIVRNARGDVTERTVSAPAIYTSAADVKTYSSFIPSPGAEYWIYPNGDETRPMLLYCQFNDLKTGDTLGTPKEYLTFPNSGTTSNFATVAHDGSTLQMNFTKIRLDPSTLTIDTNDTTFMVRDPNSTRHSIPSFFEINGYYGKLYYNPVFTIERANIDLTDTPFFISPKNVFTSDVHDHIFVDPSRKVVDISVSTFPGESYVLMGAAGLADDTLYVEYGEYSASAQSVRIPGKALRFNDLTNDGDINMGSSDSLRVSDALTLEAWIYPTGVGVDSMNGGNIINKEGEYQVARFADESIRWALAVSDPYWTWVNTGYKAPENQWSHIAIAFDQASGLVNTFINGRLFHSMPVSGSIGDYHTNMDELHIGSRQNPRNSNIRFQGSIDEVRIWNIARDESHIKSTFGMPLDESYYNNAESGLIGYWRFDEISDLGVGNSGSNDVRDFSIYKNHGDIIGDVVLTDFSTGIATETDLSTPTTFSLGQNYPNPFNPTTTIEYTIEQYNNVKVTVFDIRGRELATLVNEPQQVGTHRIQLDASSWSTGLYFYRLTSGKHDVVKKMMLVK